MKSTQSYLFRLLAMTILIVSPIYSRSLLKKRARRPAPLLVTQNTTSIDGVNNSQATGAQSILDAKRSRSLQQSRPSLSSIISQGSDSSLSDNPVVLDQDNIALPLELQPEKSSNLISRETIIAALENEEAEKIDFQFENATLKNFIDQIQIIFGYTFLYDEMIQPERQGARKFLESKISFKTHNSLSREEAWALFNTFLDMALVTAVKLPAKDVYRIQSLEQAGKAALPVFIGTDTGMLPSSDELIRYVYFVENAELDMIIKIVDALRSPASRESVVLKDQKAFILTDKAYNIKKLMEIVLELDKVSIPQAMSVLKLRKADADTVKELYKSLLPSEQQPQLIGPRRPPTNNFFENVQIISEPRTNSLILLGAYDAIKKIEDFIIKNVDVDLDQPYSKLFVYPLKFADAEAVVEILNKVTEFGKNTPAGKSGGVRGQDQYFKSMSFVADKEENRIIIKADYNDYLLVKQVIDELDEPQPQVAVDVLVLSVRAATAKEIGTALRSKGNGLAGLMGTNIKFQTSGLRAGLSPQGIQTTTEGQGVTRLLGNLLQLVTQAPAGNTILTLGQDLVNGALSVWGIFQMLQTITNTQVIANPFVLVTNKAKAKVSVGTVRRVATSRVIGTTAAQNRDGFDNDEAGLSVQIIPQINADGMVIMDIEINFDEFTNPDPNDGTKTIRAVKTQATVANQEVIAIGGLIRDIDQNNESKTPLLGDVPLLGWLFKNKRKDQEKNNLLILMSPRIIEPENIDAVEEYTDNRIAEYHNDRYMILDQVNKRDAISRWFFTDNDAALPDVGEFIFNRNVYQKERIERQKQESAPLRSIDTKQPDIATESSSLDATIPIDVAPVAQKLELIYNEKSENSKERLAKLHTRKRSTNVPLSAILSDDKGARL